VCAADPTLEAAEVVDRVDVVGEVRDRAARPRRRALRVQAEALGAAGP
jgi:hypothetical protein